MPTGFDWIAIYGAVLASASLGWQVFREFWSNRVRLRITCSQGVEPNGNAPARPIVLLTVSNLSTIPIQASEAGLSDEKGVGNHIPHLTTNPLLRSLPTTIEPGHSVSLMWHAAHLAGDRSLGELKQYRWVYVRDGRGTLHCTALYKHFWTEFARNLERQEGIQLERH